MAGRGTDIVLGGDAKAMAKLHLQAALCEAFESREEVSLDLCLPLPKDLSQALLQAAQAVAGKATSWSPVLAAVCDGIEDSLQSVSYKEAVKKLQEIYLQACQTLNIYCEEEGMKVKELGGLKVIGTERHEAKRIDQQLRGRAGRQGDPGSSRFCLSLADRVFSSFWRRQHSNAYCRYGWG